MGNIDIAALDDLSGEVLPERTVLGVVSTPFNNAGAGGSGSSSTSVAVSDGGGNHGATALSSCQATSSPGTPGLLGSLGLGSANPGTTMTCTPAAISSY